MPPMKSIASSREFFLNALVEKARRCMSGVDCRGCSRALEQGVEMSRLFVILLLLSLLLSGLGGCTSDKKKAKAAEDDKTKMAEAQHQVRQNPDKFESSD